MDKELEWLEKYNNFLLENGLGDTGEIDRKVRERIIDLKIERSRMLN